MRTLAILTIAAFVAAPALAMADTAAVTTSGTAADAPTATTPEKNSADPDQRVRCRVLRETGSLVKRTRICRTVAEWRESRNNAEGISRDYVEGNRGRPAGGP